MSASELAHVEVQSGVEVVESCSVESDSGMVRWSETDRAAAKRALLRLIEKEFEDAAAPWRIPDGMTLKTLSDRWLDSMRGSLDPGTIELYRYHHLGRRLIPHFVTPERITKATIADYGRQRLREVKRETLQKERSTLRGFLSWCHEQGLLNELPEFPPLPRRATGTAFHKRRRGRATELSPEECRAIIAALPRWSRPRADLPSFPVRARFIVMHETALRPATLDALSVPEHYSPGSNRLIVTDEIDKARFGRVLPLTDEARRALDSVAPESGLIFGTHCYRNRLENAARKVLPPEKARTFTQYDFRHARITELAEGGNLTGTAYIAGHKQVTTTSIYVRPGFRAGESALEAVGARRACGASQAADARYVAERTSSELRAMKPPEDSEQLRVEWQILANLRADELHERELTAADRLARKRRRDAPTDPAAFDAFVESTIAAGEYSSQHALRAVIGCCLARLRRSLDRLTRSGRIAQVRKSPNDWPPYWRVVRR